MRFEELLQKSERKGLKEGLEKGFQLIDCMEKAGEPADLSRLAKDPEYLKAMLEKYHL